MSKGISSSPGSGKPNAIITPRILLDSSLIPSSKQHPIVRPTPLRAPFANNSSSKLYGCERIPPERDISPKIQDKGYVTNVMIDRSSSSIAESGYQIIEDEEDPEDLGDSTLGRQSHQHPSIIQGKSSLMKYKPKRKNAFEKSSHHEEDLSKTLEKANRLLDVKAALEQMTVSNKKKKSKDDEFKATAATTCSSSCSSVSSEDEEDFDNDCEEDGSSNVLLLRHADKALRSSHIPNNNAGNALNGSNSSSNKKQSRKVLSQETLNTTVTSAGDEFVWIDSHNRLVELQSVPWNNDDLRSALPNQQGNGNAEKRISLDLLPR
ncbi:Uncharacterized protein FKW44_001825 [Caligus rogercresseyi]|uniref:Uncharacterized protein n=1 Tax=Caligus rogercresseyi TaxID=217165 RepID=A0A7T8KJM6_CALRO|nr:Uncharacterized protein FKW44_001825 [Caligus rogercresseyi]